MLSLVTTRSEAKRKVATPWGAAELLDEVTVPQRAAEKRFSIVVQLLETGRGEPLVRIAYSTGGTVRRGPVTMRTRELERLRAALGARPALRALLAPEAGGDA